MAVVRKDLLVEFRTRERVASMGAFGVLVGVLFHYAIDPVAVRPQDVASGILWMTVLFAGILGVGRTFHLEDGDGAMSGLLHSPVALDALYVGKLIANVVLLWLIVALILVTFAAFFRVGLGPHPWAVIGILALGSFGFVALTTLFSAVSARTSMGESLLPVLVFPLLVPVIIFGVSATSRLMVARPLSEVAGNVRMLGAFALLALAAGVTLFRFVVEE